MEGFSFSMNAATHGPCCSIAFWPARNGFCGESKSPSGPPKPLRNSANSSFPNRSLKERIQSYVATYGGESSRKRVPVESTNVPPNQKESTLQNGPCGSKGI